MLVELGRLAIGNLLRARARLAMTSGGVLVGTCAVILLVAMTNGLQASAEQGFGANASLTEISVYPRYNPAEPENIPQLDLELVRQLWQLQGVAAVVPSKGLSSGGSLRSGDYMGGGWVQGIEASLLPYLNPPLARGDLSLNPGEVIIGEGIATGFFDPEAEEWTPITIDLMNDPLELLIYDQTGTEHAIPLKVVGTIADSSSLGYNMYMPIQDVLHYNEEYGGQELDPATFTYDSVMVYATDRDHTSDVMEQIREMGYEAGGMVEFLNQINDFFSTMRLMLGGIGGVALLVAAFGVANTMMMAILERTREIGLMKAIGAKDGDVLSIFLIEAGLVGLVGGTAGVLLSYLLRDLINQAVANMPTPESGVMFLPIDPNNLGEGLIIIPSDLVLLAVAAATLVGLAAGFYPAWRAANLPPVTALKQE